MELSFQKRKEKTCCWFYDVKEGKKVGIDEADITKKIYTRTTKTGKEQQRFAFRGKTADGRNDSICEQSRYDAVNAPLDD